MCKKIAMLVTTLSARPTLHLQFGYYATEVQCLSDTESTFFFQVVFGLVNNYETNKFLFCVLTT